LTVTTSPDLGDSGDSDVSVERERDDFNLLENKTEEDPRRGFRIVNAFVVAMIAIAARIR